MQTILDAYKNSDAFGKGIVDLLLIGSMVVWSIMVMKIFHCYTVRKACERVKARMKELGTSQHFILGEMVQGGKFEGPLKEMASAAVKTLNEILFVNEMQRRSFMTVGTLPRPLTDEEMDRVQVAMDAECNAQQRLMEEWLPVMGAIITLAPMLGLLGTVWGVMLTFINMVKSGGRPDIESIGPGISGALLTTVGGLLVAIPSMAINYGVVSAIQKTDKDMEDFESMILASLRLASAAIAAKQKTSDTMTQGQPATTQFQPSASQPQPIQPVQATYQAPSAPQPVQATYQAPAAPQPVQATYQAPAAPQPAYQAPQPTFRATPSASQPSPSAFQTTPLGQSGDERQPSTATQYYRVPGYDNAGDQR